MKKIIAFIKTNFLFVATGLIGLAMTIFGQVKFDYAKTDIGYKWGEAIGWAGIAILVASLLFLPRIFGEKKK